MAGITNSGSTQNAAMNRFAPHIKEDGLVFLLIYTSFADTDVSFV